MGRSPNKKMLGGFANIELHDAVDIWLNRAENRQKSVTDFVVEASLEKLARENIPVDVDAVKKDHRYGRRNNPRLPIDMLNDGAGQPSKPAVPITSYTSEQHRKNRKVNLNVGAGKAAEVPKGAEIIERTVVSRTLKPKPNS